MNSRLALKTMFQGSTMPHTILTQRAEPERTLELPYFIDVAHAAEHGGLDSLHFADTLTESGQGGRGTLDPLALLGALAAVTERIGLAAKPTTNPWIEAQNRTCHSSRHTDSRRSGKALHRCTTSTSINDSSLPETQSCSL
jgi:hypothetical protein